MRRNSLVNMLNKLGLTPLFYAFANKYSSLLASNQSTQGIQGKLSTIIPTLRMTII